MPSIAIAGIVATIVVVLAVATTWIIGLSRAIERLEKELYAAQTRHTASLQRSRSTIKGQLSEQMFPLSVDCPYNLADMKFFGQPFDYLVLTGYAEGAITEVRFVEIKTGTSKLSSIQRSLRDSVHAKRVYWDTVAIAEKGAVDARPVEVAPCASEGI